MAKESESRFFGDQIRPAPVTLCCAGPTRLQGKQHIYFSVPSRIDAGGYSASQILVTPVPKGNFFTNNLF